MDEATDQQSRQHDDDAFIIRDDHSSTGRWKVNVIDSRHGILASVGSADSERNERGNLQVLPDVACHDGRTLRECIIPSKHRETLDWPTEHLEVVGSCIP